MENPVDKLLDKIRLNSVYLTNKHINIIYTINIAKNGLKFQPLFYPFLLVRLV